MEEIAEIVHMGGYGAYVWPAFIISALILVGMVIATLQGLRRAQAALYKAKASALSDHEA